MASVPCRPFASVPRLKCRRHHVQVLDATAAHFGDFDNDGDMDVYLAGVSQPNQLWLNNGRGTFASGGQPQRTAPLVTRSLLRASCAGVSRMSTLRSTYSATVSVSASARRPTG